MSIRAVLALTGFGALASAVTAGVYLNFSLRIMPRFADHPDAAGLARMQAFNRTAVQAPFMVAFFGAALVAVVLLVRVGRGHRGLTDLLGASGGLAYLLGFLLTIAYNVPLNDKLARLDAEDPRSLGFWRSYLWSWTSANSGRAGLSVLAALLLVAACGRLLLDQRRGATTPATVAMAHAR